MDGSKLLVVAAALGARIAHFATLFVVVVAQKFAEGKLLALLLLVVEAFTASKTKMVARRRLWATEVVLLNAIDGVIGLVSDLVAVHLCHLTWEASHSLDVSCGSREVQR